ncbi:MAG: hypothetical protein A2X31_07750 [Elusimicrobia bacterium GWB2_63_22]|nr:MAG: hypothetical protein A2X31_07750 [Elusimicrobia bacterium GWB2_63_22]
MKYILLVLISAALAAPAAAAAGADCAAQDMQLFYYYLNADRDAKVHDYPTACHPGKTSMQMPGWLDKALPAMLERKVWKSPEDGELSEAAVWQTPVSILYEFNSTAGKAEKPLAMEAEFSDLRIRFNMSVDRVARAKLEGSFEGRGGAMLASLDGIARTFDELTGAVAKGDQKGYDAKAAELMKRSRGLFSLLFEAPEKAAAKKAATRYTPEARLLPGYRGVSLPLAGSQALFVEKGDRVDMLVTFEAIMTNDVKEKITATILQNVLVTAVVKPAGSEPGVVQLLCNPNEAQYAALSLAQASNINLTRRAPGDTALRAMEIASFGKLLK